MTPVRLCCMTEHEGVVCPDGKVMCEFCFERFTLDELFMDGLGVRWDVCKPCQALDVAHQQCTCQEEWDEACLSHGPGGLFRADVEADRIASGGLT